MQCELKKSAYLKAAPFSQTGTTAGNATCWIWQSLTPDAFPDICVSGWN